MSRVLTNLIKKYKNKRIAVLYGGWSHEREVSIMTGKSVVNALKKCGLKVKGYNIKKNTLSILLKHKKNIDIAFIAMHGVGGEDGSIQAILESLEIPYTGSEVLASALALNKYYSKQIFELNGVLTPQFVYMDLDSKNISNIKKYAAKISYPCIVKPESCGSAIGVYLVKNTKQFKNAVSNIKKYDKALIIEEYIKGREITVGILGDQILPITEIKHTNEFYDYEAKYKKGASTHITPAKISKSLNEKISKLAKKSHDVLGCTSVSRVDMIIDKKNVPWVLEVNTIPGLTETSLLPDSAHFVGIGFEELVLRIIDNS